MADRIPCPVCGHQNSPARATCKVCRLPLSESPRSPTPVDPEASTRPDGDPAAGSKSGDTGNPFADVDPWREQRAAEKHRNELKSAAAGVVREALEAEYQRCRPWISAALKQFGDAVWPDEPLLTIDTQRSSTTHGAGPFQDHQRQLWFSWCLRPLGGLNSDPDYIPSLATVTLFARPSGQADHLECRVTVPPLPGRKKTREGRGRTEHVTYEGLVDIIRHAAKNAREVN